LAIRPYIVLYVVLSLPVPLRRAALTAVAGATACVSLTVPANAAASGPAGGPGPYTITLEPPPGVAAAGAAPAWSAAPASGAPVPGGAKSLKPPGSAGAPPRQLFVPDLIAAAPSGITPAEVAKIGKLAGVRAVLPVDGGRITVNGRSADILGVSPQAFRSWAPPETAAADAVWTDLGKGDLVSTRAAASRLRLTAGNSYQLSAAIQVMVPFGAQASLSVPGVDAVVDAARSSQLGLVKNVAVLINAPGAQLGTLMSQVRSVIGTGGQVRNLVAYSTVTVSKLPVTTNVPTTGIPTNYLMLYKESAAQYCPSMSWTVLAAIGEIESGNGANVGPSSAGALGPMQFMPATWAAWGIDGFGQTGPPDIMNPLDAVPSAARMLCADGAGNAATLRQAIFDYNHANWYVDEVLALASEYAQGYH
jgi:hypothetical protein